MNQRVEQGLYIAGWVFGALNIAFWIGCAFAVLLSEEEGFLTQTRGWIKFYGIISTILVVLLVITALLA